ncbi:Uncharacterised protein [Mycobacterium tuberculosis]|nr:Uncharacterised protein [Mycobacterium tuberculosis]
MLGGEAADVGYDRVEVLGCLTDLVRAIGQQRGHRGQVVVEPFEQVSAVMQRRDQRRQVRHGGEDVFAVVTESRNRL